MIRPKKFFVKTEEKIFDFDEEKREFREPPEKEAKTVILGVHSCDIHALKLLDRVYIDETPDKYYTRRREEAFLIGVDCHPDEKALFSKSPLEYER